MFFFFLVLLFLGTKGLLVEDNGLLYETEAEVAFSAIYQEYSFRTESPTLSPTKLSNIDIVKEEINNGNIRICYLQQKENKSTKSPKSSKSPKYNKSSQPTTSPQPKIIKPKQPKKQNSKNKMN